MSFEQNIKDFGLEYYGRYYSSYLGTVDDHEDEEFRGRVKVYVPEVADTPMERWAEPKGLFSGDGIGLFALPGKGDQVWVEFMNGNPRFPIWQYGPWKKGQVPGSARVDGNKPKNFVFQVNSNLRMEFNTKDNKILMTNSNLSVEMDSNSNEIKVKGQTHTIKLGEKVELTSNAPLSQKAILGETAKNILTQIVTTMNSIDGAANYGANAATIAAIQPLLQTVLSNKVTLG